MEEILTKGKLPRIHIITLETGTTGLKQLFETLQFPTAPKPPHPFIPEWSTFVEKASSGELLSSWLKQKGK